MRKFNLDRWPEVILVKEDFCPQLQVQRHKTSNLLDVIPALTPPTKALKVFPRKRG
jgi:hypothetical protein